MKLLTALTIALLLAGTAAAFVPPVDDAGPITGTWLFTIETSLGMTTAQGEITTNADNIIGGKLTGPNGDLSITGGYSSDWVRIYASDDSSSLVLDGTRSPGAMSGAVIVEGSEIGRWSAQRK